MIRTFTAIALVTVASLSAAGAWAGESHEIALGDNQAPQEIVDTSRVNFNDRQQVEALYSKLRAASARVCAFDSLSCKSHALTDAVRQINRPELTAFARGESDAPQMADAGRTTAVRR